MIRAKLTEEYRARAAAPTRTKHWRPPAFDPDNARLIVRVRREADR